MARISQRLRLETVLTRRELEILAAMADGRTNAEIAGALVITEGTVKSHVKSILRKLGATNRTQAVCVYCVATVRARFV